MADSIANPDATIDAAPTTKLRSDIGDDVLTQLRLLRETFDAKIRYDEIRERQVDSMSTELEGHRQGLYQKLLEPVLLDLVTLYTDLSEALESPDCPATTATQMNLFRDALQEILARNGAEPFSVEGEKFDRAQQKVIRVVETPDPALDRQVAERLRVGFRWNGKVLRPEWIAGYRYVPEPVDKAGPSVTPPLNQSADSNDAGPDRVEQSDSRAGESIDIAELEGHTEEAAN